MSYQSNTPYHTEPMHGAVVYCSDGRASAQSDEFAVQGLDLARYDRLTLPGGPAALVGHDAAKINADGILEDLRFLVDAHDLDKIVLIQHEDCAFYQARLGVAPEQVEAKQIEDLNRVNQTIRGLMNVDTVLGYIAKRTDTGVTFDAIDID